MIEKLPRFFGHLGTAGCRVLRKSFRASNLGSALAALAGLAGAEGVLVAPAAAASFMASSPYAVQINARVQPSVGRILLQWVPDTEPSPVYRVYRKAPDDTTWGSPLWTATNPDPVGGRIEFADTGAAVGTRYEYRVTVNESVAGASHVGYGYILAGNEIQPVENRGTVILVVDATVQGALAMELARLQSDLEGDGWKVHRLNEPREPETPPTNYNPAADLKAKIKQVYDADPANVKAVFLLGRLPVPYSGQIHPDGHTRVGDDHTGAWPADVYYGDMDGSWTTGTVHYINGTVSRVSNTAGDNKFDQSTVPPGPRGIPVELQVGRVDFHQINGQWARNAYPSEVELLRAYLEKDHKFRHQHPDMTVPRRALIADSDDARDGQAYLAPAYRSYAPILNNGASDFVMAVNHSSATDAERWYTLVTEEKWLLTAGAGSASWDFVGGLGTNGAGGTDPNQFVPRAFSHSLMDGQAKAVFYMLYGSWLGDWDSRDNILRTALATPFGLGSVFSVRPQMAFHAAGLGETLGYCIRANQNNDGTYQNQVDPHFYSAYRSVHIALLGDPTLRLHPVPPVQNFWRDSTGSNVAWSVPGGEGITQLRVYYRSGPTATYQWLQNLPATANNLTVTTNGDYLVRTVKLEVSGSGSYYNLGQGIGWTKTGSGAGDTTRPTVNSFVISATAASSLTYQITFSESVTGVNAADFATVTTGGATATVGSVSGGGSVYTVGVNFSGSSGTVGLNLNSSGTGIADASGNAIQGGATGQVHTISGGTTTTPGAEQVWFDDSLPPGAWSGGSWRWVPAPGGRTGNAHESPAAGGAHDHGFAEAFPPMTVAAGEKLFAWVYIDPANPPSQILISWFAGNWEHRAYWGANQISYGTNGTASQRPMGALPPAGGWVRLTVDADGPSGVDLAGRSVTGMNFSLFGGHATFDTCGKIAAGGSTPPPPPPPPTSPTVQSFVINGSTASTLSYQITFSASVTGVNAADFATVTTGGATATVGSVSGGGAVYTVGVNFSGSSGTVGLNLNSSGTGIADASGNAIQGGATGQVHTITGGTTTPPGTEQVWFDDSLPPGAWSGSSWRWVPAPGGRPGNAHESPAASGAHDHGFAEASPPMSVAAGEKLFAWVYIDPANPPSQILISWFAGNWEHRAYWGANQISWGTNGTASQRPMGPLPAAGGWVRLTVDADGPSGVDLAGRSVTGMNFSLFGGHATFDTCGKIAAGGSTPPPPPPPPPPPTSPTVQSFVITGSTASTLSYQITFSASVTGVNAADFATVTTGGATATVGTVSGGGAVYSIGVNFTGSSGTVGLNLNSSGTGIADASGNAIQGGATGQVHSISGGTPTGSEQVWFDDSLPPGAWSGSGWRWVPAPGGRTGNAHESPAAGGAHDHGFAGAFPPMTVAAGEKLFAWVYIDPANPPSQILISWFAGNWEHRAYWGANQISWGTNGTAAQRPMGPLPAAGGWVRLTVDAEGPSGVDLAGRSVTGMNFSLFGGHATFDTCGKIAAGGSTPPPPPPPTSPTVQSFVITGSTASTLIYQITFSASVTGVNAADFATVTTGGATATVEAFTGSGAVYNIGVNFTGSSGTVGLNLNSSGTGIADASGNAIQGGATGQVHTISGGTTTTPGTEQVWFDDSLPAGAWSGGSWRWVPAPGGRTGNAHESPAASGVHDHGFAGAFSPMTVAAGEKLFAWVYIDPANPPTEILISWFAGNWEHRAYWGANQISYGTNGTASQRPMGPLPAAGGWVRLTVDADGPSGVDLAGRSVTGINFSLFGGHATFDTAGKLR